MMTQRREGALRLLLQFLRAQESGDPYAFRFEAQDYILPTEGGDSPSARFDWTPAVLADLQAIRQPGRDPAVVQRVGDMLRRFVLHAGWAQHEAAIAQAQSARRPIFLTIRSSAAELYALPWELLTLSSGQFLGEIDGLLLRFEWPESHTAAEEPKPPPGGGRILFAWSAAGGPVPAAEHLQAITRGCAAGFHPFQPHTDVIEHASLGRIASALEAAEKAGPPIAVLHLLCHGIAVGSTFGLVLDGSAEPAVVDSALLRQQLGRFSKMVRLVVLSACDSGNSGSIGNRLGSVAQNLHRCGFAAVLASRFPLSVPGSIGMTEVLYRELLGGPLSLESALLLARKQLAHSEADLPLNERMLDWASLQLYARYEDGDDTRPVAFRPFRGLLAFQLEHRRFFFGRDAEVNKIIADLQALITAKKERLLVVAGASGSGKSSLVLAGAVPQILEATPGLAFLRMRPGRQPMQALDEALAKRPAHAPALLVVDQFEELFTQTQEAAARSAFTTRLWTLAGAPAPELRIILTLRVDFIGRCGELLLNAAGLRLDSIAYEEAHRIFIAQLRPEQLRAVIVEPLHKVGLELEAGLVERILTEVGNEPGALPLLEDALDVLWQRRRGRTLTQAAYDELGGVIGALQRRADELIGKLSPSNLAIAQRLLTSLVAVADDTTQDTRLRVSLADLQQSCAGADPAGFAHVLKELVDARLLVPDGDGGAAQLEVAHEALIRKWPKLRGWLAEDRAALVIQHRIRLAARHWEQQSRDESLLYRGGQLAQAVEWRKSREQRLGEVERRFLDACEALERARLKKEQKRVQQARLVALVLGILCLVATAAGLLAYRKSAEAKRETMLARDGLFIGLAQALRTDATQAAIVLREAGLRDSKLWIETASSVLRGTISSAVLRGHESRVTAVAMSPDGSQIASGGFDTTVRIWNADGSGKPAVLKMHTFPIAAVAYSPDGKKLATSALDLTVRITNVNGSGDPVVLQLGTAYVTSLAFSPDGKRIAGGTSSSLVQIWNVDGSGQPVLLKGHTQTVGAVAFSADGKLIISGSHDQTVRIWDADSAEEIAVLKGHTGPVHGVAISPYGSPIISGSGDGTLRLRSNTSSEPTVLTGHGAAVLAVAVSPRGDKFASASEDRTVRVWTLDGTSNETIVLEGHQSAVTSLAFSKDGKKLVSGSNDGTVRTWSPQGPSEPTLLRGVESLGSDLAKFSKDGKRVITAHGAQLRIWNIEGERNPITLSGHQQIITSIAVSPDGKKIVSASRDNTVRVWSTDGTAESLTLKGHTGPVLSVAISADGTKIASGAEDQTVRIWNMDGSKEPLVLLGHQLHVTSVAFSPDGKKIVTSSLDKTLRLWNTDGSGESEVLILLPGLFDFVYSVAFSPDGTKIAAGGKDGSVRIFRTTGPKVPPIVLHGHVDTVGAVVFSPDGKTLASGSTDKTARIWNADGSGDPIVLSGFQYYVTSVAYSPDSSKVLCSSLGGELHIFRVRGDALESALWDATTDCLSESRRSELLMEPTAEAQNGYKKCRQEVARRHGWQDLSQ